MFWFRIQKMIVGFILASVLSGLLVSVVYPVSSFNLTGTLTAQCDGDTSEHVLCPIAYTAEQLQHWTLLFVAIATLAFILSALAAAFVIGRQAIRWRPFVSTRCLHTTFQCHFISIPKSVLRAWQELFARGIWHGKVL